MCEACYRQHVESTSRGPIRKLPNGIVLRYETPDGEIFTSLRAASEHTQKLKDCYQMYDERGERTEDVGAAIVLHIQNNIGMKLFLAACQEYMKDKHSNCTDVSGGLIDDYKSDPELFADSQNLTYLWHDSEYIFLDDEQVKALRGYIKAIDETTTEAK
jgi:hypothetical protein